MTTYLRVPYYVGSCHSGVAYSQITDGRHGLQIWRAAAEGICSRRQPTGGLLTVKIKHATKSFSRLQTWAQDRDKWWVLINTAMNLRVPGHNTFLLAEQLLVSEERTLL